MQKGSLLVILDIIMCKFSFSTIASALTLQNQIGHTLGRNDMEGRLIISTDGEPEEYTLYV